LCTSLPLPEIADVGTRGASPALAIARFSTPQSPAEALLQQNMPAVVPQP